MIKKTALFTIALLSGSFTLAFAGEPGNQMSVPTGISLTAPETSGLWTIGLEAQMMDPLDNFQFVQGTSVTSDGTFNNHNESVDNEHDWGWEADIAYQFANTAHDLRFSFTDLNMSDTETYVIPNKTIPIAIHGINGRNNSLILPVTGQTYGAATYHYRAADLVMGQLLTIGQRVTLHPFAGLRYSKINPVSVGKYVQNTGEESKFSSNATFDGIGPRIGTDASVRLGYGFSLVGTLGSSLLIGKMNEQDQIGTQVQPGGASSYTTNNAAEITSVIPELDGSFGLDYHFNLSSKTAADLQAGLQVVDYFNAGERSYNDLAYINSTVACDDFAYHGVYIRSQVSFI